MALFKNTDYSISKEEFSLAQKEAGLESIRVKNESINIFVNKAKDYLSGLESAIPSQELLNEGQAIFIMGRDILNKESSVKFNGGILNSFHTMHSHPGLEDYNSHIANGIKVIKSGLTNLIQEVEKFIK